MSIPRSIVRISDVWGGIAVRKKNSLGKENYYCIVDRVMFGGWTYSGKRTDEYYFPYTENEYKQVINSKDNKYKKGKIFSVFSLDFVPDGFVEFENLLDKDDMMKKNLIEGTTIYGVKNTTPGILGMRTPVSKIQYPIVRKGCISVISHCFELDGDNPRYYIDIGYKTVDGGGIYYYVEENNQDKLIGMSKDVLTRGVGRDTVFYDLSQVDFITEAKELILQLEKDTLEFELDEDEFVIDPKKY